MEISSVLRYCFSHELGMEDPNVYTNEGQMSFLDHHHHHHDHQYHHEYLINNTQHIAAAALGSGDHSTYSTVKRTFSTHSSMETPRDHHHDQGRPSKLVKTNSWNSLSSSVHDISNINASDSPNNNILSFGSSSDSLANNISHHNKQQQQQQQQQQYDESMMSEVVKANYVNHQSYASNKGRPSIANNIRPPHSSRDHIIAERKRREKLSQRFIALSAILPNLKKMDKASVLGDAIKYMKQLQEKVDTLEEKLAKKSTVVESAIFVKKSLVILDESKNNGTSDHNSSNKDDDDDGQQPLPEIEVRVCGNNVLIRIHCDKHKCVLLKILSLLEDNLKLTVTNSNLMPFADSALQITIVARMDEENCMTVKDLVKNLRSAFLEFM
ncbi:hypothetical protein Scep_018438 [Stephania cephalantha]|uniref:BHLH domain-containing protein n=1 Tax=Stephania cephalantha TaxID=152367 RepID=A0AAP0NLT2_9MAGN